MKFAVIKTGGKQYKVAEGDVLKVEKLPVSADNNQITLDQVLLAVDGETVKIGQPFLADVKVEAENFETGKSKKVLVFKYKSKTRYRVKRGHRQPFTRIKIAKIDF